MAERNSKQNLKVSPAALESLYHVSQRLRADVEVWGGPRVRPDIIVLDLALGLSDEMVAQRHGLPREFITEFRRSNRELVLNLQENAFQAHALLRVLVSTKAALYLDAVVSGELEGKEDRLTAARALLVPVPNVVTDSADTIVGMFQRFLAQAGARARQMEPPVVPTLEEFLARVEEEQEDETDTS